MTSNSIESQEGGLHRSLSGSQISMIAIGGAIGTGLFLGSGYATNLAGPAVLLSFAIGAVISMMLIACLAEMTVLHPMAGSFGVCAEKYIGPWAGFLVRYTYWAGLVLGIGLEISAVDMFARYWFVNLQPGIAGAVLGIMLIGLNGINVKAFGSIEYLFSSIKVAAILAFIGIAGYIIFFRDVPGVGFSNYVSDGGFFSKGIAGVWNATLVAVFSYTSIEMVAIAAGEAKDPHRAIASAFKGTIIRLVLFYLVSIALMLAIVPWQKAGVDGSPFVKVMEIIGIPGTATVLNFILLIAALSAMNSEIYITSRIMFSLSRSGYAPKKFSVVNERGVPVLSLIVSSVGAIIGIATTALWPEHAFIWMMALVMFAFMFVWSMIFITHIFFRKEIARKGIKLPFKVKGYPYFNLLGLGLMLALMISTAFFKDFEPTLTYGVPFIAFLSLVYFFKYRKKAASTNGVVESSL
ncbi:amino acid permease [Pseudomonas sp. NPDC089569]|uniref:amino acid permease n=1 Tax=Pseudomonas sp. NPDC089569 TaxID=3390722 RepID=UPI003CFF73D2